ncbi:MAG: hypothetical protein K9M81_01715 [Chthoniobacterales bacterium]|nr:hypothetical protein [Chthoniobacterales bacterium]
MNIQFPLLAIALFMMGNQPILQAAPLHDSAQEIITSDDYGAFLNRLEAPRRSETSEIEPAKNSQEFYEEKMATDPGSSSLIRLGEPGNYTYAWMGGESPLPLHFISISDAELYSRWKEVTLMPLPDTSSQSDRLLKTSTSAFQIQSAPNGTSGHQSMVEEVIPVTISEILGGMIELVVARAGIREYSLHSTTYRITDTGWEEGSPSAAGNSKECQWKPTDRFDKNDLGEETWKEALAEELLLDKILDKNIDPIFIQNHSRSDSITKRIESYQQRLDVAETQQKPEEIKKLTDLINVLKTALGYQNSIIGHLENSATSSVPKIEALQRVSRISEALRLNERPNKIEMLAEKLEHDYTQLAKYQERVQDLQKEIEQQAGQIGGDDRKLIRKDHLLNAITHQSELIKARVERTTLLRPPYETLSKDQQAKLNVNKWLCIEKEALARSEELLAQTSLLDTDDEFTNYLYKAIERFKEVASEAQEPNRNPEISKQIIDLRIKSASLYEQAAEAEAAGQGQKAEYLSKAGHALYLKAEKAQKHGPACIII